MSTIGAVILAAGMSTRMGQFKPIIRIEGKPLFHYAVDAAIAAGLTPIVLVGGYRIQELIAHAAPFNQIEIVENKDYASGMASSLRLGVEALSGRTDAAFVFLADQPLLNPNVVEIMKEQYAIRQKEGLRIIRPSYRGAPGHPVLFDAELYAEFTHLQGDEGGKQILAKHRSRMLNIPFNNAEWGYDIDTPEDLLMIRAALYEWQ